MSEENKSWIDRVYESKSSDETKTAYAGWAATYDADLYKAGYRGPAMIAAMHCRYATPGDAPILEAAVGTGLVGELLSQLGYENLVGIDMSNEMLEVANGKNLYSDLQQMRLGDPLDFPDDHFAATSVTGAFTPGHAGPESLPELIRVTRPGAPIIFSLRVDGGAADAFIEVQDDLQEKGLWEMTEKTATMNIMPLTEPDVFHRFFVYRVN